MPGELAVRLPRLAARSVGYFADSYFPMLGGFFQKNSRCPLPPRHIGLMDSVIA
jgi:hypothetical protein